MSTRFAQVTRLTTAALAAVAVLAACSPGDGIAVQSTAGTATPSPELLQPETKPSNEELQEYVDVSDFAVEIDFDSNVEVPAQYGSPAPGVLISRQGSGADKEQLCSLGPAILDESRRPGFLTAGHCADGGVKQNVQIGDGVYHDIGPIKLVDVELSQTLLRDSGLISSSQALDDSAIAGVFPVDRVMPLPELRALEPGTPICVNGAISGIDCSPLITADANAILFDPITRDGDSGGAVFVVTPDHRATLVGIARGARGEGSSRADVATFLAPVMDKYRLMPVTAN